jgi:hypothetical protein
MKNKSRRRKISFDTTKAEMKVTGRSKDVN